MISHSMKRVVAALLLVAVIFVTQNGAAEASSQNIKVTNISGTTSTETANKINKYALDNKIHRVYIASNQTFADALTGGVLAGENEGALVYTDGATLDESTREIVKEADEVVIFGGVNAVSQELEDSIEASTTRIEGYSRYGTATEVALQLGTGRDLLVVSGENFADSLSGIALAQYEDRNILLVGKDVLPEETKAYLESFGKGKDIIFAGGPNAISNDVKKAVYEAAGKSPRKAMENVIYGESRYDTSVQMSDRFDDFSTIILSTGTGYTDALAASTLANKLEAPVLIVNDGSFATVEEHITDKTIENIIVLGGNEAIRFEKVKQLVANIESIEDSTSVVIVDEKGEVVKLPEPKKVVEEKKEEVKLDGEKDSKKKGKDFSYSKSFTMEATAYDASYESNGKWGAVTALGTNLRPGVVAVDRKVIPLGTKLYIESMDSWPDYGYAVAEDTGGAIKGMRIDLFFESTSTVWKFGRRNVKVYILD